MNSLHRIRVDRGMTMEQLARLAGTTVSSVYRYETGLREPSANTAVRLARALGVTVEDLVTAYDKAQDNGETA